MRTIADWLGITLEEYIKRSDQNNKDHLCVKCHKPAFLKLCDKCSCDYGNYVLKSNPERG